MPRLWTDTIEEHREAVRNATLDAAASLIAEHGLRGVTMSQIAREAGIGRATLYKYFSDVEDILVAWHERLVHTHLEQLTDLRDHGGGPAQQLAEVLGTYALMRHEQQGSELAALLHRGEHVARAQVHLKGLVGRLLREAAASGEIRDDIPPDELAAYCLNALGAAAEVRSKTAVRRLVGVTLTGIRIR